MLDLATPWCLRVVATLRVANLMADGTGDVEALAAAADCDPAALHHVLSHLVSKGVFREEAQGRFALNPAAEALPAQSPFLDLEGIGGRFARAWPALLTYTRTGEPGYAEIFGRPFWRDLGANPELAEGFDALMAPAGDGQPDADLDITGGWEAVANVVDVGGGTGAFLATLLGRHPHLHGTLVDLPGTVERSAAVLDAAGMTSRAEAIGQSFFDPLPAGADVYVLRKVLDDWPDEETKRPMVRGAPRLTPRLA
ncbi:MAG TPA: methyltransferase, partial [Acidimicrobiales bacterium]|nr:methyltransferase [Acidimicrobiales bacterium]